MTTGDPPGTSTDPEADLDAAGPDVVDARGLRCPMPIIAIAARAKDLPAGTVLTLLSTDPATEPDLAAWCRMRGHVLLSAQFLASGTYLGQVRLGGSGSGSASESGRQGRL